MTIGVVGGVCLLSALLTSWMLGVPAWVFAVVFAGLVVVSLIRPPNG
ncbi:MAG: hypothetical protein F2825_10235 [Actinobacteria bacterium]|jgi:uncharacterized protein (DUF983 family)|uniref:Uncharacterized protein n=2 Tax=root TaxID=1 RepID=A0ABU8E3W9_9ACTN|nr:hypothetical protein [Klenkia terrae]MSW65248.1 hypothetical protein [Actinomycetota bacterium]SSC22429.1 Hypothetical protein KLENKIAIHU_1016 [Klenkia terrae]